jgi:hypothetical protein
MSLVCVAGWAIGGTVLEVYCEARVHAVPTEAFCPPCYPRGCLPLAPAALNTVPLPTASPSAGLGGQGRGARSYCFRAGELREGGKPEAATR